MGRFVLSLLSGLALCLQAVAGDYDFVVAPDGSGDFRTVQEAVDAAPDYCTQDETLIYVRNGIYKEKVVIPAGKQRLHIVGESAEGTVITWDDYALRPNSLGYPMGTFATSTVFVYADDFLAENISFVNSAGEGKDIGQACAITVDADRVAFLNCRFIGNQDTVYTSGKKGKQRVFFRDCWIEGTTDFIFGASVCWFEGCIILSKKNSYVTAASTPEGYEFGYVFSNCRLVHDEKATKVYLGRPWRSYAKTVFINCYMDGHIVAEGWHNWNKPYAEKTVLYAEYGSTGPGAAGRSGRVRWARFLKRSQLKKYTPENVLSCGSEQDKHGNEVKVEWYFKVF